MTAGGAIRGALIAVLVAAPLAFGAVYDWGYITLHVVAYASGIAAFWRARRARASGVEIAPLPARGALVAFFVLVAAQLVPLPPAVLRAISPGSHAFYANRQLVPLTQWYPVSVSPADTFFGLVYLVGAIFLGYAAFREMGSERWRRRLLRTVLAVGVVMTLVGLVQAANGATRIYGFWNVRDPWALFGPYLVKSHFGGYMIMAAAVGLGFAGEGLLSLRRAWTRRRVGWLALGDPAGSTFARSAAFAMVPVVGLLACGSRGAFLGFVIALLAMAAASRSRSAVALILAVSIGGASWVGLDGIMQAFSSRGLEGSRLGLWRDALRMFPDFPVLGFGFNAFGMAYLQYQTFWRYYFYQSVHNEYLDVLLGTGLAGAAVFVVAFSLLLHRGWQRASRSPLDVGVWGALVGLAGHNLVDFNWQIQANAATWAVLLGLALQPERPARERHHALA